MKKVPKQEALDWLSTFIADDVLRLVHVQSKKQGTFHPRISLAAVKALYDENEQQTPHLEHETPITKAAWVRKVLVVLTQHLIPKVSLTADSFDENSWYFSFGSRKPLTDIHKAFNEQGFYVADAE